MAAPAITSTPVMRMLEPVRAEQRDHAPAEVRDARRLGVELLLGVDVDRAGIRPAAATPAAHAHARQAYLRVRTGGPEKLSGVIAHRPRRLRRQPRSMTRFTTVPMMTAPKR